MTRHDVLLAAVLTVLAVSGVILAINAMIGAFL